MTEMTSTSKPRGRLTGPEAVTGLGDLEILVQRLAAAPGAPSPSIGLCGVSIGTGSLAHLLALAASLRRGEGNIAVLVDRRPMRGRDDQLLKSELSSSLAAVGEVRVVAIGDADGHVHADPETLDLAVKGMGAAGLLVSVGSGTVTDIGKYTSRHLDGLPHIVVQTAASVNGFADDQSVLLVDGVKRTTPTRWPDWLIIDSDVISRAPAEMNRAGLGDLLASYTAAADWRLAAFMRQDTSFSPTIVQLTSEYVDAVLDQADAIGRGVPSALDLLAAALAVSGIAMGVAGKTAPGSGMEHTVSHLIEMTDAGARALHGAQVGILSVISACVWQLVREAARGGALAKLRGPSAEEMERRVRDAFDAFDPSGAMAAECWNDYRRKLERHSEIGTTSAELVAHWRRLDADLEKTLAAPDRLADALVRAGAPTRLSQLGIEPARARWALESCHLMRDRFTVADLAFMLGLWDTDGVEHAIEMADNLGCGL